MLIINAQINLIVDDSDPQKLEYQEEKQELLDERTRLECLKSTSNCNSVEGNAQSSVFEFDIMTASLGGFIALLVVVLLFLLFAKGRGSEPEWNYEAPHLDTLANSTYGGAAPVFQNTIVPAGPPIPPGGIPAGWTMEQWRHYGQNYLDGKL